MNTKIYNVLFITWSAPGASHALSNSSSKRRIEHIYMYIYIYVYKYIYSDQFIRLSRHIYKYIYPHIYLIRARGVPRLEQFFYQQAHWADLKIFQPVPRDQGRREDVLLDIGGALGLVYLTECIPGLILVGLPPPSPTPAHPTPLNYLLILVILIVVGLPPPPFKSAPRAPPPSVRNQRITGWY